MTLTPRQRQVKEDFVRVRGTWDASWESVLRFDPDFLEACLHYFAVPLRNEHLSPKVQDFISIVVDAAATHLYEPGVRVNIARALEHGATPDEIMEVLELTSTLGVHTLNLGVPLLAQVLEEEGLREGPAPLDDVQEALKAEFVENRGYWHAFWDEMLELDPDIFEAYTELSSVPWKTGTLEPKLKEFVYIAFDSAATHLYVPGWKEHIRNALRYGATPGEILEVMEIASAIGVHTALVGAPLLAEEVDRRAAQE